MKEFDIYLPAVRNDGSMIEASEINHFKAMLARAYGGYTHFQHRNEGAWSIGGVTFRDEVTIVRVLDDGSSSFDLRNFKQLLEKRLDQETILIVAREVSVVS